MSNLLALHSRHTPDDASIWRAAIQRGWKTERLGLHDSDKVKGYDMVRYYGNVLHAEQIASWLPIRFYDIGFDFLPKAYCLGFTNRMVDLVSFSSIPAPLKEDTFVKSSGIKWIESRVYKAGETVLMAGLPDDLVYIQEPVKFVDEIRCFVLDGEIQTASYYRVNGEYQPRHISVKDMEEYCPAVLELMKQMRNSSLWFPLGVVLDFGRIGEGKNQGWALIEANEAWASGLYDCDPDKAFEVIIHSHDNYLNGDAPSRMP